jgi:hypothetical protein
MKEWDIVWFYGDQRLVGLVNRPKDKRFGVCTVMIPKEIVTSAIRSKDGNKVLTRSGSVYLLDGDRKRRDFKTTGFLSVGGPEDLAVKAAREARD